VDNSDRRSLDALRSEVSRDRRSLVGSLDVQVVSSLVFFDVVVLDRFRFFLVIDVDDDGIVMWWMIK